MKKTTIHCPNCGTEIAVSEALAFEIRADIESLLRAENERRLQQAVAAARSQSRDEFELELRDLKAALLEKESNAKAAQERELALRKQARALEDKQREFDLELKRRLDQERYKLEEQIRKRVVEEQALKLGEKEKLINDLRKALDAAKRKTEQGSQEHQGAVMEIDLHSMLTGEFPNDQLQAIAKGTRGADIMQEVHNSASLPCGKILWESKNTRHWSPGWIDKLKDDQRAANAAIAVLVSVALPENIGTFGFVNGVWVSNRAACLSLAFALREQLIQVAFARNASVGKHDKMEALYRYLSGDQFRLKVEAIVEAFSAMQEQLYKERRAMEKLWKEREKQIQRIMLNTVGMYGDMRGIVGSSLPAIDALELDETKLLEDGSD